MYKEINGMRLRPVSPKMFVQEYSGAHGKHILYENEKGVRYYIKYNLYTNNPRTIKVTHEKIISQETIKKRDDIVKQKKEEKIKCIEEKCKNKGLRGKERIRCLNACYA